MKTLLKLPTTTLMVDYNEKIVVGIMKGNVDFEDYKSMLIAGTELAGNDMVENIIVDRRNVMHMDVESRLWVKNYYIREYSKPVVSKIKKFAVVEARSAIGRFYGKTIHATLRLVYPHLHIKYFKTYAAAERWILEDRPAVLPVDQVLANEQRLFHNIPQLEKDLEKQKKVELINQYRQQQRMKIKDEMNFSWKKPSGRSINADFINKLVSVVFP